MEFQLRDGDTFGSNRTPFHAPPNETIGDDDRAECTYIGQWCTLRHLEQGFIDHACALWLRLKSRLGTEGVALQHTYTGGPLYTCKRGHIMICIQLSMKWNGYDERYKVPWLTDFTTETGINITPKELRDWQWYAFAKLDYII